MSCMGPERNPEREEAIFLDVLAYVQEQCGLLVTPRELIDFPKLKESRDAAIEKLREAVGEIVWQDDCEGF